MRARPVSVTLLAWLLIVSGLAISAAHLMHAWESHAEIWLGVFQLTATLSGAFLLRGQNWARWLAMVWIGFHVAISFGHPLQKLIVHSVLLVLFAVVLFRRDAQGYFRAEAAG